MVEGLFRGRLIKTYSGHYIDVFDPKEEHINIIDIAHALSHTPRWQGHTQNFYSVAQHSIWCAHRAEDNHCLEALLHDATEAYIGDMPSPIKKYLPDYQKLEKVLDTKIREVFGLPAEMSEEVKQIDRDALNFEWNKRSSDELTYRSPAQVKDYFLFIYEGYKRDPF